MRPLHDPENMDMILLREPLQTERKIIRRGRTHTNLIQTLKSTSHTKVDFAICTSYADKGTLELQDLYQRNLNFVAFFPISVISEIPKDTEGKNSSNCDEHKFMKRA